MFPASMLTHIVWRNVPPDPFQGHPLGTDGKKRKRKRPTGLKYNKVKDAAPVSLSGVGGGELGACAGGSSRERNRAADMREQQQAVRDGGGPHAGRFAGTKVYSRKYITGTKVQILTCCAGRRSGAWRTRTSRLLYWYKSTHIAVTKVQVRTRSRNRWGGGTACGGEEALAYADVC
jgi:hypothetical protein